MTEVAIPTVRKVDIRENDALAAAWANLRLAKEATKRAKAEEALARAQFDRLVGSNEVLTAGDDDIAAYRHDGAFSVKRFSEDLPHLATQYTKWRAESYLDEEALEADHPMLFTDYRARTLRMLGGRD